MPPMIMTHDVDPKQAILDEIGDLDGLTVSGNDVLVAVYLRPEKTASGIFLTDNTRSEDKYQSKVGLVLKMGPDAFVDPTGEWFKDAEYKVGDWVWHRPSDGWSITVNKVLCRVLKDTSVRGTVAHCDYIW